MPDLNAFRTANAIRWANAKLTRNFVAIAKSLVAAKPRYQSVEEKTGVPWFVIAVIHEREGSQRWDTQLAQGDPLHGVSTHVPRGKGPYKTWEDGAIDALVNCPPHLARNKDWTPGGGLTAIEGYNGYGPEYHDVPSGYIWAGTNQYTKGKYIRDGVWDSEYVDTQPGCAALIKTMMALDPSISFGGKVIPLPTPTPEPKPVPAPEPKPKAQVSLFALLLDFIASLFRRK